LHGFAAGAQVVCCPHTGGCIGAGDLLPPHLPTTAAATAQALPT